VLARKLAKSLPPDLTPIGDDLSHVAQLRYKKDGDRSDLEVEVEEFYKPLDELTSDFHRDLARLPFTLCLTTTPAHFLSNAFRAVGKLPILEFYHFRKTRPTRLAEGNSHSPIVYHLYGDLAALDSIVLTETDLLEFLVNVVRGAPPLPPYIVGQLADPQTSFLFLGFGFQRWYTRVLLHVLQMYHHRNRSMAVEAASFFDHPDSKHTALFFEKEHKIEFRQHTWVEFAAELCRRYEAQVRMPISPEPPPDAPRVFLCYDSRDRDRVKTLRNSYKLSVLEHGATSRIYAAATSGIDASSRWCESRWTTCWCCKRHTCFSDPRRMFTKRSRRRLKDKTTSIKTSAS
jgi:hypothetical protein